MAYYNFNKDKLLGDEAEDFILNVLHQIGFEEAYKVEGKYSAFDIVIPSLSDMTIEVKNDLKAAETGNIAIEIGKKDGTETGIFVSRANFWCIFAQNEIYFLDRLALKDYALSGKFRSVYGGDLWNFKMILIPILELKKQTFFNQIG